MPPRRPVWTRLDLRLLIDALHLSRGDWKRLLSLLPSRPPSHVRARLVAICLPTSRAANTWDAPRLARAALALHAPGPPPPPPAPPSPPPSAPRRRGRVAVRITPATHADAAAVRDTGHNPCVEVVLRGVRPLWDITKHLYVKWSLPVSLHHPDGNALTQLAHHVFALVHPDRPKEPLLLTFRLMPTRVHWDRVGPLDNHDNNPRPHTPAAHQQQFDPSAPSLPPNQKPKRHVAPPRSARPGNRIVTPKKKPLSGGHNVSQPDFDLFACPGPLSKQRVQPAPSRAASSRGKRVMASAPLHIDSFDPFASPTPVLKAENPPVRAPRPSRKGSKRVSAPAPLDPSFDPFATPDRARSGSTTGKRAWNIFDSSGSPEVPANMTAKRARVPWIDFDVSASAGQFATPISSRHPPPFPPLPESLDGFSNSAAASKATKSQRIALVDFKLEEPEQKGSLAATTAGANPAMSTHNELHVPRVPALLEPADLGLMSTPANGEKAVMKRLRGHLERLEERGAETSDLGHKQQTEKGTLLTGSEASRSAAAIPEAFLKSQSGLDMPLMAKLPDSMLSVAQSEGSVPATQPGSRASGEGSVVFDDGNASDGFGFGETSAAGPTAPAGPLGSLQGPDFSLPAANRSFSLGDVSLGIGSRPFEIGIAPDSQGGPNQSLSLSGLFRGLA